MHPNSNTGRKLSADRLNFIQLAETAELGEISRAKLLSLALKLPLMGLIKAKEAHLLAALIQSASQDQFKHGQKPIVFKSNATLAAELGYARPETISRMLSYLFDAGLITMKDSANYKRHSTRRIGKTIIDGFGIDLRVFVARYDELIMQVKELQLERQKQLTAVRQYRAVVRHWKNALACTYHLPAAFIHTQTSHFERVARIIAKSAMATTDYLERAANIIHRLTERLFDVTHENIYVFRSKKSCSHDQTVMHIDNTTPENSFCNSNQIWCSPNGSQPELSKTGYASKRAYERSQAEKIAQNKAEPEQQTQIIDLNLLLKAVPFVREMLPNNPSWPDLIAMSENMAGICGVSNYARNRAEKILPPQLIAAALAVTLQKYSEDLVKSPAGYFVGMINKAENNELRLNNSIFALAALNVA